MGNLFTYVQCIFFGRNEAELPDDVGVFLVYNTVRATFSGHRSDRLTVRVDRLRPGACPPSPTGLDLGVCHDNEVLALLEVGFDEGGRVTEIVPAPDGPGGLEDEAVQAAVRFLRTKHYKAFGTTVPDVSTSRG
jgi:hypothetical protein